MSSSSRTDTEAAAFAGNPAEAESRLRQRVLMIGTGLGGLICVVIAWLDWIGGVLIAPAIFTAVLSAWLFAAFGWAISSPSPIGPARMAIGGYIAAFLAIVPVEIAIVPAFAVWLPTVPLLVFFFFGFREGLIWSTSAFLAIGGESLALASRLPGWGHGIFAFKGMLAYLFVAIVAGGYQRMIEQYRRAGLAQARERERWIAERARLERLEDTARLAGGVAHDFNNLLVGVVGGAELLEMELPAGHPSLPVVRMILESGERGAELVRQLQAFASSEHVPRERLSMRSLVEETLAHWAGADMAGVRIRTNLAPVSGEVFGNRDQFRMLLRNLLANALDARLPDRECEIRVELSPKTLAVEDLAEYDMAFGPPGEGVLLRVQDNGRGMSEGVRAKAFEAFFTTQEAGTGMGLAAVAGITKSAGGALALASRPGEGCLVSAWFPFSPADGQKEASGPQSESGADTERPSLEGRVMVVDDEREVRLIAGRLLASAGADVVLVASGEEALQRLANDALPDIVLLDYAMPGMDGEAVLKEIRKRWPTLPVVVSSGYEALPAVQRMRRSTAGFVHKPWRSDQLLDTVRHALSHPHEQSGKDGQP
ncbi:MAG: response regulator [Mariprofundaceae bacterium]